MGSVVKSGRALDRRPKGGPLRAQPWRLDRKETPPGQLHSAWMRNGPGGFSLPIS
jgi:hypothetical protein